MHTYKDLTSQVDAWYFHSTYVYLLVMTIASFIFYINWRKLKNSGIDINNHFSKLPDE